MQAVAPCAAQSSQIRLADIAIASVFVEASSEDSNFTVIDARFDETGTAAVLFGVIGAAANSASNAAADDRKADALRAAAADIDLKAILERSARATFAQKSAPPLADERGGASHTLIIEIRNWGLQRQNKETSQMRAFLNLSLTLLDAKSRPVWRKERENAVGVTSDALEAFTDERLKSEMEELARKSGQYVANQIIYR